MPQIPTARRLQLGRELRRLREEAGITRDQVAVELDGDLSKVSRIETGKQGLSVAEVRHLLRMFGVGTTRPSGSSRSHARPASGRLSGCRTTSRRSSASRPKRMRSGNSKSS